MSPSDEPRGYRLLVLLPFAPRFDAPHGGGRSLAQLVDELSRRHRVALLCLRSRDDPPTDEALVARCDLVEEFVQQGVGHTWSERWGRRARLSGALACGRPMWVADTWSEELARRIDALVASWRPDIVQAEFHVMGQYLPVGPPAHRVPAVLTEHEPGAAAAAETARAAHGAARPLMAADALAWKRFERRMLPSADAVVAFTERDRVALDKIVPHERLRVIPLSASLPAAPLDPAGSEPPTIVFVGNFIHPPNAVAAARLVHAIFPAVLARCPGSRLELIGDRPPAWLRDGSWPGVTVTGKVPDVTPHLDRAAVVVAPLSTGGGLRVKVLEALAFGKALVASPLAVEGIALTDGRNYLRADGDAAFADAVALLLGDERRRVELGRAAREWAEANLGWQGTVAAYEALYAELLAAQRR